MNPNERTSTNPDGVAVGSCTYPDCACVPNGDVGCNSPNAAARGANETGDA